MTRRFLTVGAIATAMLAAGPAAATPPRHGTCPHSLSRCPIRLGKRHVIVPGVNDNWHVRPDELADAPRLGAHLIRFPFTWASIQGDPQSWDWASSDRVFAEARARGSG